MINLILINSLICVGLYKSFQFEYGATKYDDTGEGSFYNAVEEDTKGIFWWWKFYVLDKINYRVSKPLGNCLTCMASVYSVVPYFAYYYDSFTWDVLVLYPFYILAVAGLNSIFAKILEE